MLNRPVIGIVPGFCSGRDSYQPLFAELEDNGFDAIYFPSKRWGDSGIRQQSEHYPRGFLRQAAIIVQLLRERDLDNVTLIGHSMGGAIASVAAALGPDVICRIILVCSACVHPDTPLAMGRRFFGKAQGDATYAKSHGQEADVMLRTIRKEAARYVSNPWRTLKEAWALARFSALEVIDSHRVDVRFVYGERDTMFACSPTETALRGDGYAATHCLRLNISHDPQNKPDEAARLVAALLQRQFLPTP